MEIKGVGVVEKVRLNCLVELTDSNAVVTQWRVQVTADEIFDEWTSIATFDDREDAESLVQEITTIIKVESSQ